jgi:outer membrane protein assembly factor BamA
MTITTDSISRSNDDILIEPDLSGISQTDFEKVKEIIERGRIATIAALPDIRKKLGEIKEHQNKNVTIENIVIGAMSATRREEMISTMKLDRGVLSYEDINRGLERLLRYLRKLGYGAAQVSADVSQQGTLVIAVDPGVVREIKIEGVPKSRWGMVMREVFVKTGQPLHTEELIKSLTSLHATGRYTIAYSYLEPHPSNGLILTLLLEEAPFPKLGLGLGFDTDRQARYFAKLDISNGFFREGEEFSAFAAYGMRDKKYRLSLRADRLARTYLGWEINGRFEIREQDLFNKLGEITRVADVYNGTGEFNSLFNLYTWGKLSAGIKSEWVKDNLSGGYREIQLNGITLQAKIDTEDRKPFPRSGALVSLQYDNYLEFLGSEEAFNRVQFEVETVFPLSRRNVIKFGWQSNVAEVNTPLSHRFRLGGMHNFPALETDRFMALRHINGNVEWRYDLISRFAADAYILTRYDIAAFSDDVKWRPKTEDLIHSSALGFALDTWLGPLELWYAYSPSSNSTDENYRVTVNLGYHF